MIQVKFSKLELKLFFKVIIYGIVSIALYLVMINVIVYYINHLHVDLESYKEQIKSTAEDFQSYITDNDVSIKDLNAIRLWDKKQNLLHIKIVEDNRVIYDSLDYIARITPKISYIYYGPEKEFSDIINFPDGKATLYITILYKQRIEQRLDYVIGIFCTLLFLIAILNEFKKLVRDILYIKKGIQILEGGNLSYEIVSKRKDELTELADSINRLSKELCYQRKEEENLRIRNYDLVTSISHDIRTPLTTVNSYTDLIIERKYANQQELDRYLIKIKEKSNLINDLTDNLFTHFLNQNTDYKYNYEVVIGNDFIKYILNSMGEGLRDKGYQVNIEFDFDEEFFLKVDVMQIQRVFNNLEGNLIKYAQKNMLISYSAQLMDKILIISGQNSILDNEHFDSHGVGILNCQEIIKLHSGEMNTYIEEDSYHVNIRIPVCLIQ